MAEKFTRFTAVAAPYDPVNVDTDQIIPARFLKAPREQGYGAFLFHDVREDPDFVLNREPFDRAKILVANTNFGCGSSREGAPYAFHDAGFRSVIAPSFGDIFFNNCMKNGIVPVRLAEEVCASLRQFLRQNAGAELTVDLQASKVITPIGEFAFSIPPFFREMLLEGVDEIGLTLSMLPQIEAFEKDYAASTPWLTPLS
jgi:3-isopropylmalate/(R)-2-methylmalate dehydratase small subunit